MEKRIAFMSTGCQISFGRPREIIAGTPELVEVNRDENPDYIMANFCAISTENLNTFDQMRREIIKLKRANPHLRVLAGGCIEGMSNKKDLSFADAIYHHQEEGTAFLRFLGYESEPRLQPSYIYDAAHIVIAQGCNRRCTFCKVHYLKYMQVQSRPMIEIIGLVQAAIEQGIHNIHLIAENASEYGCDIGTNLCSLLRLLFATEGVHYVDISGICLDEIGPELFQLLQDHHVRQLQLEVQSLYDPVRRAMGLHKTRDEVLAILDALQDKAIVSNFITGFPNSNVKEFEKELKLIRMHHLYYLTLSPYDDTVGTPSHQIYQKPTDSELLYYQTAFMETVAAERQLLLEQLMSEDSIEASITGISKARYTLMLTHFNVKVIIPSHGQSYQTGDLVHVKVAGLHKIVPEAAQRQFAKLAELRKQSSSGSEYADILHNMQYFGSLDQIMMVKGIIVTP